MQRIAIIDIGSNSARLVISHIYKSGAYNMVYNQKEALRLSQKVDDTNMLTEEAFASTIDTMRSFAHMCKVYQADKTIAVATAAIRNASNGAELVAKVAAETGSEVIAKIRRSGDIQSAEDLHKTVIEALPDAPVAGDYRRLAEKILAICGGKENA